MGVGKVWGVKRSEGEKGRKKERSVMEWAKRKTKGFSVIRLFRPPGAPKYPNLVPKMEFSVYLQFRVHFFMDHHQTTTPCKPLRYANHHRQLPRPPTCTCFCIQTLSMFVLQEENLLVEKQTPVKQAPKRKSRTARKTTRKSAAAKKKNPQEDQKVGEKIYLQ